MELLLGEHGQALQYALIGIIIVSLINVICITGLNRIMPEYNKERSKNNREFAENYKKRCPVIDADEIIYVDYLTKNFDLKNEIKAKDCNGNDITESIKIFGSVDTNHRGLYSMKCIVRADNGLKCIKNINVIVE